ncbi:MAG: DNA circularization N-terminal domain-containing protein, partial [Enhydrobacter sp.]|nr:DNA circularization N-terminal domain-containing protein [Enhydrobacter sp.]
MIAQSAAPGGRRHALHEYPDRDLPYAEDLGRRARKVQLACYFVGPLVRLQAKAFRAALEKAGPGVLIHPIGGRQTVLVDQFDERVDRSRTDWVEYAVSFVEAGQNFFPSSSIAWPSALTDLADRARTAFGDALDGALNVVGQAQEAIEAVQAAAGDVLEVMDLAVQVASGRAPATAIAQALLLTGDFGERLGGVLDLVGFAQETIGVVGGWADALVGDTPTPDSRNRAIDALWAVYDGTPPVAP